MVIAMTVTVLISAYAGTEADDLARTLDSLREQTEAAARILVVKDGPVSAAVEKLLQESPVDTLELGTNQGLGPALQAGLNEVTTPYVARIDTDDIAFPERLAVQRAYLDKHPEISVVGTAVQEFDDATLWETGDLSRSVGAVRSLPENPGKYARLNSPLNHPSIMARTEALTGVGGYRSVHLMEDYDLWARLLAAGHQLRNLPEPLTYFRVSSAQFDRRTKGMSRAEWQMQRNLVAYGLVSRPRAVLNFVIRMAYRALPQGLITRVYSRLFHRQGVD